MTGENMKENMKIWDKVHKTDPKYTKQFTAKGGFQGTAINGTHLAREATKLFGPMGIGWGIDILEESEMRGAPIIINGNVICFETIHKIRARLWYTFDGVKGEVIQFGQTTFVGKNSNGIYTDEEAPKKSLTDAMSKCLSLLGFGSDVHLGNYDDNKYVTSLRKEFSELNNKESIENIKEEAHVILYGPARKGTEELKKKWESLSKDDRWKYKDFIDSYKKIAEVTDSYDKNGEVNS